MSQGLRRKVMIFLLVGLPRANISRKQSVDKNSRWNADNGVLQLSTIYLGVWMNSLWAISKTTSLTCFALGTVSQLKRSRRSNHSFSCSLSSFPFRERLTSSLSSLVRYARKDSNERYSFTASSPKRKAVVKALPNLIGIKLTCWYLLTVVLTMACHSATCKSCLMTRALSSLPIVQKSLKEFQNAESALRRTLLVYCPSPSFSEITNPEHVKSGFDSPYLYSPVKKVFILVVYTCYIK